MDITELRGQIDEIDDQLVKLFCQRMDIAAQIAAYKKENGLPIYVPAREREKLMDVAKKAGPDMDNYTRVLYSMLFELSRSYQSKQTASSSQAQHFLSAKIAKPIRRNNAIGAKRQLKFSLAGLLQLLRCSTDRPVYVILNQSVNVAFNQFENVLHGSSNAKSSGIAPLPANRT